jgi:branched-subunit amino acid aminotransferase/4-amino-4-deoxychorismate lyase
MDPAVPPDDRGLLLGDGLFETVLFKAGPPVLWAEHMARLVRGCAVLGLPGPDPDILLAEARRVADGLNRAAVRLTWTAGSGGRGLARPGVLAPRLLVTAAVSPRSETPAALVTSAVRRNAGSPASRLKTLSYLDSVLARRDAAAAGADEALMLDTDGRLASASAANLFWIAGGRLYTPSLDGAVLGGIMRAQVLAAAPVEEVAAGPEALAGAEALFLTSSLIGLRPVSSLDGRAFAAHPLVEDLRTRLSALT